MINLREEVTKVLGLRVEEGHWDEAFARLDVTGKFTQKVIFGLLLIILKKLDEESTV